MMRIAPVLACAVLAACGAPAEPTDEARFEAGALAFDVNCSSCHIANAQVNLTGPNLVGVVGRKPAAVRDYDYSPVMRQRTEKWTREALLAFLADPMGYAPGTRMGVASVAPGTREAIVYYLERLPDHP